MTKTYKDPCTFSNPDYFILSHADLDWQIDFDTKVIEATCRLTFQSKGLNLNKTITLDTRDLLIKSVSESNSNTKLNFTFGEKHSAFGTPLTIDLSSLTSVDESSSLQLLIDYKTSPNASALQWIDCQATCGKKHPYLFSQCQAIHARSILPCQDTPLVKFTYNSNVTVRKPLVALMSACSAGQSETNDFVTYKFEQKIAIPSYLLAIVVGDLVSKDIGPISRVWTERELIDDAAYEFAEVNEMVRDAENILGDYVWGRYDLLVLPPSFPYGGMENPCLTFVTPTLIAKDRSLVCVVQHEITHSWTGNLVTNCSWEHFWLNEGFTYFIERILVSRSKKSEKYRQFEFIDSLRHLKEEVKNFGETNQLTQLVVNLTNIDPDDAFSTIPYVKGALLLYYLETLLGGIDVFTKYLKAHIEKFKGLSIDSDDWKAYLYEYFSDKKDVLDQVDWTTWLYKPGMPPVDFNFDQTLFLQVEALTNKIINSEKIELIDESFLNFESSQKKELLSQLLEKESLSCEKIQSLNDVYKFGETFNSEILFTWIRLCIKSKWKPIIYLALKFVSNQGRMKFTRPVYRDLFNWQEAREQTIETFKSQRVFMHQTTASLVAKDLNL